MVRLAGIVSLLLAITSCAQLDSSSRDLAAADKTHAGPTVPPPAPKVGDWWRLRYPELGGTVFLQIKAVADGHFVTTFGSRGERRYSREWNRIDTITADGGVITYDRPLCFYSFPMWVGKKWNCMVRWRLLHYEDQLSIWAEAVAWEQVTVPAGTFEAMRVDIQARDSTTHCWYAPSVNAPVKCEVKYYHSRSGAFELVSFGPTR